MAVDITLGARVESGVPRPLFSALPGSGSSRDPARHQWSVTADGARFLVRIPPGQTTGLGGRGQNPQGGPGTPAIVPFNYVSTGQGGTTGGVGTRGGGGGTGNLNNLPPAGLTVIRHWMSLIKDAKR